MCDSFESIDVCERERDKGKNRGSFGNLIIGGGAGTATWTMCFRLLLKCPKCLFTNIPKQTTFLFFFFGIKISKFSKTGM